MPSVKLPQLEIIYKEVFVMKYLYTVIHEWLQEEDYVDVAGLDNHYYMEIMYLERRIGVKELRIWWRSFKYPTGPPAKSFYRYRLDIDYNIINMVDVEIMHNGRKMKVQNGEISIKIQPIVEWDWQGRWEKHPLLKYFQNVFLKRVLYKNIEDHKKEVYRDAYRLQGMIKKYLELKSFMPEVEVFHEKFDRL
jgi:hypothetical protein